MNRRFELGVQKTRVAVETSPHRPLLGQRPIPQRVEVLRLLMTLLGSCSTNLG